MLAYILAVLVGTGSVGLYVSAFFFPEIHRKQDFGWSGVGFFYALVLWVYARQETGGILLGQSTSVALLGWLAWQNLQLRRQLIPVNQQTPLPSTTKLKEKLGIKSAAAKQSTVKPFVAKSVEQVSASTLTQPAVSDPASPPQPTVARPPAKTSTVLIEDHLPQPMQQVFQPPIEEEAWIKLEVKPAATPSKPLGTAAQPPVSTAVATSTTSINSAPTRSTPVKPDVKPEVAQQATNTDPVSARPQIDIDVETENWD